MAQLLVARAAQRDPCEVLAEILERADDPLLAQRELLVAVFELAFDRPARYSPRRWDDELFDLLERLDHIAGRPGAACAELVEAIELHASFLAGLARDEDGLGRGLMQVVARSAPAAGKRPRSFAFYVLELRFWLRERQPEARLRRRIARAERVCRAHGIPLHLLEEQLAPELRRRERGKWCRVRLALKRAAETCWRHDPHLVARLGLSAAENVRWNKTWRSSW